MGARGEGPRRGRAGGVPRIVEGEAATGETADVAGGEFGAGDPRGRGDLRVEGFDRPALAAAGRDDLGIMDGSGFVEGQHAAGEIVGEHRLGRRRERRAPAPFGQRGDAVEDLGLVDARRIERGPRLSRDPGKHRRGGL